MMRRIHYTTMDPSGNVTLLVDTPVPRTEQPAVAAALMAQEPRAEQAGFLTLTGTDSISLRMAGGEFCGNAAMSAAVLCAHRARREQGTVCVTVAGTPGPLHAEVAAGPEGAWEGSIALPLPRPPETVRFPEGPALPVVAFPGISHVILEHPIPQGPAEMLAKRWCAYLGAEALGLMFFNRRDGRLTPLVYVPGADTVFWENACGSGSAAVGWWLAARAGERVTVPLSQPGGMLTVTAAPGGPLLLRGTVRVMYEKTAELDVTEAMS